MNIPGMSEIVKQVKELPEATEKIQGSLDRIEVLLRELLEVQRQDRP